MRRWAWPGIGCGGGSNWLSHPREVPSLFSGFCSNIGDLKSHNCNSWINLDCGPGDAPGPKSRMLERLLDRVVLTVVAIVFSVAVAVLKYRRI